jgi:DNA-directed RNA polymerase subunit H (RpoH/RPB5)
MELNQLGSIEITNDRKKAIMLKNTLKMLLERNIVSKNIEKFIGNKNENSYDINLEKIIDAMINNKVINNWNNEIGTVDHTIYFIKIKNDNLFYIKFINQKITTINKIGGLLDFLNKYNNEKIIIAPSINHKMRTHIETTYNQTEIFAETTLMMNIIDHIAVPKHEILSQEDSDKILVLYNARKKDMPKILTSDPIAMYYNMKPGQICKITRPSKTSGESAFYRLVIKATVLEK